MDEGNFSVEELLKKLCEVIYHLTEEEGHCDWWVKSLLELTDEEYEYVSKYVPIKRDED